MAEPEIENPLKSEAEAQDEQTLMPWIWGGLGLAVIAVFVAAMVFSGGHHMREPAAAAPTFKTSSN
jgi:hypothetical protein